MLLGYDGAEDAILPAELLDTSRPQRIPKILHQTYKNTSIPHDWREAQESCLALHADWKYIFWTDESADSFVEQEYPWFSKTFRGYQYDIQRADAIRYLALEHYGGVYIDMDDGCQHSLDPLLVHSAWVRKTKPTGVSNDVMGAESGHPFFVRVVDDLQKYDRSWLSPYVTVMGSTGPLFLSVIWRHWISEGRNVGNDRVRILWKEEYMGSPSSFFTHHVGSSWHSYDVGLIFWLEQHWLLVTGAGIFVGIAALYCVLRVYSRQETSRSAGICR